jgi:hypothetical protein
VPDDLLIVEEVQILAVDDDSSVLQEVVAEVVIVSESEQGPPGPPGISGGANFSHTQSVASDTWTVNHNLGFRPAVSTLSVGGREMWSEVVHASVNQFIAYFDAPVSGIAICS